MFAAGVKKGPGYRGGAHPQPATPVYSKGRVDENRRPDSNMESPRAACYGSISKILEERGAHNHQTSLTGREKKKAESSGCHLGPVFLRFLAKQKQRRKSWCGAEKQRMFGAWLAESDGCLNY